MPADAKQKGKIVRKVVMVTEGYDLLDEKEFGNLIQNTLKDIGIVAEIFQISYLIQVEE